MSHTYTSKMMLSLGIITVSLMSINASASELSGNIGASSNYLWRGVAQTRDAAAIQGGIDYNHDSGFYAGTWISNVDFGDDTSYELDIYGGYGGSLSEAISYDVSYLYYAYPDAKGEIDFGELTASITWQWLTLVYSHTLHGNNDIATTPLDSDDMGYLQANASIPLSDSLSIDLHYGYSQGDIVQSWYSVEHYSDYSLGVTKETQIGSITCSIVETDLPRADPKALLSYNYSFDL